jgi:FKBP-type peptidyl-prolyl cis-trans isomerase FkpA
LKAIIAIPILTVMVAACADAGDRADVPATASTEAATTYAPNLGVDLQQMQRQESGLYIQELQQGTGEPLRAGQTAVVHYTGWLPDGREFDSSRGPGGSPFQLVVGRGDVIRGWDEGLQGMRPGGRRRLVLPPSLAYGVQGAGGGVIPPNATLVFDVELVEVR